MPDETIDPDDPIQAARREAGAAAPASATSVPAGERPGDAIGRYKLLEEIGQGGMGTVWMAEQREPVRRRVALKIIKLGMDTREVIVRFEAERQALALMDHPHIAKVLDGGATESGRPYFVMELVRGVPITDYCDHARLGLRERLELFTKVCEALQHAHHKGVIHRDVKPSNVMVTLHDGKPVPKVIDFGIAKATSAELTQKTMFTRYAQLIGTPEYMAPEQAAMSGLDVDTRADVYSLGVLLYELLTGTRPFDLKTALEAGYEELLRTIREVDPPRPSTRVSTMGDAATPIAALRAVNVEALGRRLRGDLDWIVMKALEKDRGRRYESPSALAADVGRSLRDLPVLAAPPSAIYRFRRLVRRRRKTVASLVTIAVLLVAGSVGTLVGLVRARDANAALKTSLAEEEAQRELAIANAARADAETQRALQELERANETRRVIASMLVNVRPGVAAGMDTALLESIFAELAMRLEAGEVTQPAVAVDLHKVSARTLRGMQRWEQVERHDRAAIELATESFGEDHVETHVAWIASAETPYLLGRYREAEEILRARVPRVEADFGPRHDEVLRMRALLAQVLVARGAMDEALEILRDVHAARCELEGRDSREAVFTEEVIAWARLGSSGAVDVSRCRELLAWHLEHDGETHPHTLQSRLILAAALLIAGETAECLEHLRAGAQLVESTLGSTSPEAARFRFVMASLFLRLGRTDEAFAVYAEAVRSIPPGAEGPMPAEVDTRRAYAQALKDAGRLREARDVLEEVFPPATEPPFELNQLEVGCLLADLRANLGDDAGAEEALALVRPGLRAVVERHAHQGGLLTDGELRCLGPLTNVGVVWVERGRPAEALELLEITFPLKWEVLGPGHPWTRHAAKALAQAYDGVGATEAAIEAWRSYAACMSEQMDGPDPPTERQLQLYVVHCLEPPHPELADPVLTLVAAERLVEVSRGKEPRYFALLVSAQIAADELEAAAATLERALPLVEGEAQVHEMFQSKLAEVRAQLGD